MLEMSSLFLLGGGRGALTSSVDLIGVSMTMIMALVSLTELMSYMS